MTITSIVGASYIDHVNDDAPEVDSFSCGCYQALSSPRFEERGWERGYLYSLNIVSSFVATCLASRRAYKPVKEVPDILGGLRACTNSVCHVLLHFTRSVYKTIHVCVYYHSV